MRRLVDVVVAGAVILTAWVTVRSFTATEETAAPAAPAAPVVDETNEAPTGAREPTPRGPTEMELERQRAMERAQKAAGEEARARLRQMAEEQRSRLDPELQERVREYERQIGPDGRLPEIPRDNRFPVGESSGNRGSGGDSGPLDATRRDAQRKLESLFGSMASNARGLVTAAESYRSGCGADTQGYCGALLERIGRQAITVGQQLADAQELARKSWLPPGDVRKLRKRHGLDDGVWDQLTLLVQQYSPRR